MMRRIMMMRNKKVVRRIIMLRSIVLLRRITIKVEESVTCTMAM